MLNNKKVTIKDAAMEWVRGFNAISMSAMERLFGGDRIDDISELTVASRGDRVEVNSSDFWGEGTVESFDKENRLAIVQMDDEEETRKVSMDDIRPLFDDFFPMWGTMWSFESSIDSDWCLENLSKICSCGFRVYEDNIDGEIYIGIDGAGYDFYEAHWIPLYKARGLHWHNCEE